MSTDDPLLAPEQPDLVWFEGQDTIRFLNDLISQEIAELEPGEVRRSLLLGPQGKLGHILWVLRGEDEVGLATEPGRGEDLVQTLSRYRIRVDVEVSLEESDRWIVVGNRRVEPGSWERTGSGVIADISWTNIERELHTGQRPDLGQMPVDAYETHRILAGEPRWGVDVNDSTIPHESGLVPETVDFTKGCFLGQELVARIDSRGGNVPRQLRLLELAESGTTVGATVMIDGDDVGNITSVAGSVALASLKRGVDPGHEVMVDGNPATVRATRS